MKLSGSSDSSSVVPQRKRGPSRAAGMTALMRPWCWTLALVALLAILVSCGGPRTATATASLTQLRAASANTLHVEFSTALLLPGNPADAFTIRADDGAPLPVLAVYVRSDYRGVILATATQAGTGYTLHLTGATEATSNAAVGSLTGTFQGSTITSPLLLDATPLSSTELLLRFVEPDDGGPVTLANNVSSTGAYSIVGGGAELAVREVRAGSEPGTLRLTTEPQGDLEYQASVFDVFDAPGGRLVHPEGNSARFTGIGTPDASSPQLRSATPVSAKQIMVRFSEAVDGDAGGAASPAAYSVQGDGGEELNVTRVELSAHGTYAVITTERSQNDGETYTLTVTDLRDLAGNVAVGAGASAQFTGGSGVVGTDTVPPRLSSAVATSNTSVVVSFSEPVLGGPSSAENPAHYRIYANPSAGEAGALATLTVHSAVLNASRTVVTLRTGSQSDLLYTLDVASIRDLAGNQMAPPERGVDPSRTTFQGVAVQPGEAVDSDGDGLNDDVELRGWTVIVSNLDGTTSRRTVTSDPHSADTDEDGVGDADEYHYGTDPRRADTDADGLTDWQELNRYYSDPADQDTDSDGLSDGLEATFFGTSPLLADTDGDQFSDDYEVGADGRNPRVADLPRVDIRVGSVDLRLDVRFEEQTATGSRTLENRSAATTLTQSQESAQARETSSTLDWFVQGGAELCIKGGCEEAAIAGGKFTVSGGASGSNAVSFSTASVRASQREYATSLATEAELSAESVVTRVVDGAEMAVEVNLANASNISFTISDIEITALIQDPADPAVLVPVATLFSATNEPINIGPLTPERGPFRFRADNATPALVESLMANPRGLIFRVANYNIRDESGRNFAFVEQDVNDRTAFLEINYAGNAPMERLQVATNSVFDDFGAPAGITFAQMFEQVLGLEYVPPEVDETLNPNLREHAELLDRSYSTRMINGVDTLTRVKQVSADLTGQSRDWWVLGPNGNITPVGTRPGLPFRDYVIFADQDYAFTFVQDLDEDDLEATEELLYRSIDSDRDEDGDGVFDSRDSDRDGIEDADEVYGPFQGNRRSRWLIRPEDGRDAYSTMAYPGRADTDGDGLTDCQELLVSADCSLITIYSDADGAPTILPTSPDGRVNPLLTTTTLSARTDPANPDTDGDGLTDLLEVIGFAYEDLQGQRVVVQPATDPATPYATNPLSRDTDRDGLDDLLEVHLGSNPLAPDGDTVRDDDADGLVNALELRERPIRVRLFGDAVPRTVMVTSDPRRVDTDGDGLSDWEEYWGCLDRNLDFVCDTETRFGPTDPSSADTDGDGLSDYREVMGVTFALDTVNPLRYTDPVVADTDGDGSSDGEEVNSSWVVTVAGSGGYVVWSDPTSADRDGDSVSDSDERSHGTDPNNSDTDGDNALDSLEIGRGSDPLQADHLVTVVYVRLQTAGSGGAGGDGDADNAGEYWFNLGVLEPGGFEYRSLVWSGSFQGVLPDCTSLQQSYCIHVVNGSPTVQLNHPHSQQLDGFVGSDNQVVSARTSFSLPFTDMFVFDGTVQELDEGGADFTFRFGGLGNEEGSFRGSDLQKGTLAVRFHGEPEAGREVIVTAYIRVE